MDNAFKYKKPKKKIEFILTGKNLIKKLGLTTICLFLGFGAFGSHLTNPTSILIENILENRKEFENNQVGIFFLSILYNFKKSFLKLDLAKFYL